MLTAIENPEAARRFGQAILNTLPEPFLVLDARFCVLAASRAYCTIFKAEPAQAVGLSLFAMAEGRWNRPGLQAALAAVLPRRIVMDGFEMDGDFPALGRRTLLLNARSMLYDDGADSAILLAFTDITDRRAAEREKAELLARTEEALRQKQVLLQEMEHRVANSLQIIASILLLKARAVTSEETRQHLRDAHQRVMSVAAVQQQLHASEGIDRIEVGSYLTNLCDSLAASMVGEGQSTRIKVAADAGTIESGKAVSLGLIVTELVINAIKYAFPKDRPDALVLVTYEVRDTDWKLTVSDNGIGKAADEVSGEGGGEAGLGTALVDALAKQLDARIEVTSSAGGTSVAITRATFSSHMPKAS